MFGYSRRKSHGQRTVKLFIGLAVGLVLSGTGVAVASACGIVRPVTSTGEQCTTTTTVASSTFGTFKTASGQHHHFFRHVHRFDAGCASVPKSSTSTTTDIGSISVVTPSTTSTTVPESSKVTTTTVPATTTTTTKVVPAAATCTNPKTFTAGAGNQQTGENIGSFYVGNDAWNASAGTGSQTLSVCSASSWSVNANWGPANSGSVKTYPNVHQDISGTPALSSIGTATSSFADQGPHVGDYEFAYDIWINGMATNGSTELMIWNDNFKQTPAGSKVGSVTLDGQTYNVFRSGGSRQIVSFEDTNNVTSGTVNLKSFFNYLVQQGWVSASSTLNQVDYGVEICNTGGSNATFKVTNFTLNVK
jgi:hypothetical protein